MRRHTSVSLARSAAGPAASALLAGGIGLWVSHMLGDDLVAVVAATSVSSSIYLGMAYLTSRATMRMGWNLLRSGLKKKPV
jgi:hypothetical protein